MVTILTMSSYTYIYTHMHIQVIAATCVGRPYVPQKTYCSSQTISMQLPCKNTKLYCTITILCTYAQECIAIEEQWKSL